MSSAQLTFPTVYTMAPAVEDADVKGQLRDFYNKVNQMNDKGHTQANLFSIVNVR